VDYIHLIGKYDFDDNKLKLSDWNNCDYADGREEILEDFNCGSFDGSVRIDLGGKGVKFG
jgi:hypothetical protein